MKTVKVAIAVAGLLTLPATGVNFGLAQAQLTPPGEPETAPVRMALVATSPPPQDRAGRKEPSANQHRPATYLGDVLPIVLGKCFRCHDNQTRVLHDWANYETAFGDRVEIKRRVWDSWKGGYYKQPMPIENSPESHAITPEERAIIKNWVETGARYGVPRAGGSANSKAERIEAGKQIFGTICAACHQATGLGIPNQFPPLAGSDFLNADKNRAIRIVLTGLQGEVTVNGRTFNNSMPQLPLSDQEIASALTYVFNAFGNSGQDVTSEEVKVLRAQNAGMNGVVQGRSGAKHPTVQSPYE